jgi:tetratricopeptide (TPR) repeat protein
MKRVLTSLFCACILLFPLESLAQKGKKKPTTNPPTTQTAPALAEDDFAKAKALFERGEAFYTLGEYEKAMNEYREAYLLSKAPLFLLNIAQCYRYMGEYEEAKHNYEALIREDPNTAYKQEVIIKIAEMDAILEAQRKEADNKTPAALVVTVQNPKEAQSKLRPWLIGSGLGAVLLGGSALTFLLLRDNVPAANGGNVAIEF